MKKAFATLMMAVVPWFALAQSPQPGGSAVPAPSVAASEVSPDAGTSYFVARVGAILPRHEDLEKFDNGLAFEVVIGKLLDPHLAAEATVGRFHLSGRAFSYYDGYGDVDVTAIPLAGSLRLILPGRDGELYAIVGLGAYFVSADMFGESDDATATGVHFGAGLFARLHPKVGFSLEAKYVKGTAGLFERDIEMNSILITGGLRASF